MRYVDRHALGRWNPKLRSYVFGLPVTKSEMLRQGRFAPGTFKEERPDQCATLVCQGRLLRCCFAENEI